jgi:SAM-dependent methyltransferase
MRWLAKAVTQKVLSALPASGSLNYVFQRRVTRSLPRSTEDFTVHARETVSHFRALVSHAPELDPTRVRAYEFGAGWDLTTPIIMAGLGLGDQTLIDIRRNLRLAEVDHTLRQYAELREGLEERFGCKLRPLDTTPVRSEEDLSERLGIRYLAPRDARDTGLGPGSFEFISSTFTLEHIPAVDVGPILCECARLLAHDGVISCSVDMQDHYSYFDPSLSVYNFLKYSPRSWRLINSSLHFQNRLRLPDYVREFSRSHLDVIEVDPVLPTSDERAVLLEMAVAPEFRRSYTTEELEVKSAHIIARKSDPPA